MAQACESIPRGTEERIPVSVTSQMFLAQIECLEGMTAKDKGWCRLGNWMSRLLLSRAPPKQDRDGELKERLTLREAMEFAELAQRVA